MYMRLNRLGTWLNGKYSTYGNSHTIRVQKVRGMSCLNERILDSQNTEFHGRTYLFKLFIYLFIHSCTYLTT